MLGSKLPVRCLMIAPAIATISVSRSPSVLPNCGTRTSPAARNVNSAIPVPRGSTNDHPLAPAEGKAPKPDDTYLGHCRADHPEHLDRDRAIGIDEVRAVEIDRIDVVARHKLLQVDNL